MNGVGGFEAGNKAGLWLGLDGGKTTVDFLSFLIYILKEEIGSSIYVGSTLFSLL